MIRAWWLGVRSRCGPATSCRLLLDLVATPLAQLLRREITGRVQLAESLWLARLDNGQSVVPVLLVPWSAPLDGVVRDGVRAALACHARWAVLLNGSSVRLLDAGAAGSRRHVQFDLDDVADDERSALLMIELLHAIDRRHGPSLDSLVAESAAEGIRVCTALRHGVREALEHVCGGLAGRSRAAADLVAAYDQALTAVYRLLFLFFAEARGLVPSWHPVYREGYTMEALRERADGGDGAAGMWATFQAMSRLAYHGCEAGDLRVSPFNGRLFSPSGAPRLERHRLDNGALAHAVVALSCAPLPGGARERIAYADLGVEELGGIYESLLDHEPRWTRRDGPGAERRVQIVSTGRTLRKQTGTFYTPEPLTRFLVKRVLDPLVRDAAPEAILALRIVDPAMGSGAFLVAACRWLADAYEAALLRHGACGPADLTPADRAAFRRTIAQRCLFGVDRNPAAVQLARLSLWLTTLAADKPLGFFDHHLRSGDSLVGATLADLARPSSRRTGRSRGEQPGLFDVQAWQDARRAALGARWALEREPDDTADIVRRKDAALQALADRESAEPWRALADLWCCGWLADAPARQAELDAVASHLLYGGGALPASTVGRALADARSRGAARGCFHWSLEFPEVFCDDRGRERPDGGFDAVVGNPPWEMLRSDHGTPASGDDPAAIVRFVRRASIYRCHAPGHVNQYQLFAERAIRLTRHGGRIGLVLPHGLASDHGAAPLRRLLLESCDTDTLVGFENRRGIFPIHRSTRFLLVTSTRGGHTARIRCRFGLQDPEALAPLDEGSARDAWPIEFTPSLLQRLSGEDLAIPDVRSTADLELVEKLTAVHPRLGSPDGWHAEFGRELNATDDRRHFVQSAAGLPVIDGRNITPFRASVDGARWRIPRSTAARLLDERRTWGRPRLAFRDVTSATNRTTLIAAIVPAECVTTHTLFCLRTRLRLEDQWRLCALLNSYVANFLVRMRVTSHLSLAILHTLPVPRVDGSTELGRRLAACASEAGLGGPRGAAAAAEAHALAAHAYGITISELDAVLSSFPLVDRSERNAARTTFTRAAPR